MGLKNEVFLFFVSSVKILVIDNGFFNVNVNVNVDSGGFMTLEKSRGGTRVNIFVTFNFLLIHLHTG